MFSIPPGSRVYPPTIVCQHVQPARRTILLTSQGTFILTNMRPVDQLHHLLETCNGMDTEAINNFFRMHKEKEVKEIETNPGNFFLSL